jgi:hypothetical protein
MVKLPVVPPAGIMILGGKLIMPCGFGDRVITKVLGVGPFNVTWPLSVREMPTLPKARLTVRAGLPTLTVTDPGYMPGAVASIRVEPTLTGLTVTVPLVCPA